VNITIIGSGYVGLVTGACLADVGNNVLCLDIDSEKIKGLQKSVIPIYEPGLEQLVRKNISAGRLGFTSDVETSVQFGELQFIAVGTPSGEDGAADLQYVLDAASRIGSNMVDSKIIVNKSTVPVGTADKVKLVIDSELEKRNTKIRFDVVSNPEFLKEGAAIEDFQKPDRIIVGANSEKSISVMKRLYSPFQRNRNKIIFMDIKSAELTKYAANAMLATRISFMNELANLSEALGADIEKVRTGIGSDSRIGYSFLYPGCGYGGSCFPKDVKALIKTGAEYGKDLRVLSAVERVNSLQKLVIPEKITNIYGESLSNKVFGIWGLSFKPGTDDMREAPSITVINTLLDRGAKIKAFDPVASDEAKRIFKESIDLYDDPIEVVKGADALIILTEWKEFRSPDFNKVKSFLRSPKIFDGRNLYDPALMRNIGIDYFPIGR
jgi:UDPglucose 6-dehydrogenase